MFHFGHKFYWLIPLFSALVWLGMLLGMLLYWIIDTNSVHYNSQDPNQQIAYISDVGASKLKPLFITGATVMVVTLDLSMLAERWLRHEGRLAPNTSWFNKSLSLLALLAAIAGAIGIILLSIFDTAHYPAMHDRCLVVFIAGYVVSAIFICWEYQRLGVKYRQHFMLRFSFWYKLAFIIVEVALAIPFGVFNTQGIHVNAGAVIEWVIALVFTGYIFSFMIDLIPGIKNHSMQSQYTDRKSIDAHPEGSHGVNGVNGMGGPRYQNDEEVAGYQQPNRYSQAQPYGSAGYRTPPAHF